MRSDGRVISSGARATEHLVVASPSAELIAAGIAVDEVVPIAAVDGVGSAAGIYRIVTGTGQDVVVAAGAEQKISKRRTIGIVASAREYRHRNGPPMLGDWPPPAVLETSALPPPAALC